VTMEYETAEARESNAVEPRAPSHWDTLCVRGWNAIRHRIAFGQRRVMLRRSIGVDNARRLSRREFQLIYLTALGLSGKQAAAELRLSAVRVRAVSSAALQKLGLEGSSELPSFWYVLGHHATRLRVGSDMEVLVFEMPFTFPRPLTQLTSAERQVLLDVLLGYHNSQIAERRCTSARTVSNQLTALFAKFGAASRAELAVKALGMEAAAEHRHWLSP
jgi:DNA-binding NarL/FixJ family response regulator